MFDEGSKITLFAIAMGLWALSLGVEQSAPRAEVETAVNLARLPPLPHAAAPDGSPAQTSVPARRVELGNGFKAELLYGYVIEGRVVTRRRYRFTRMGEIAPLDLGIVWGELAEPGGTDAIRFGTGHRSLRWNSPPGATLPDNVREQITNNHLIPANQAVYDALRAIDVGSHVRISGYLVEVTGDGISPWRSSTIRDDAFSLTGCEIIFVTKVHRMPSRAKPKEWS
ncbi:hypothetical protein FIU97_16565 [Roseivivax sp. THAF40]|uniref:hypothetical protein n=1 Tax=unclassified Roseivivax TaxID=2639302 RepID=UPI001267A5DE|nr:MULTISPECIES: hypothetical protein [unclassified Roseivivax]QFS84370.1 hypothetical protein FIV09_16150 [Roseivivax sp. THAF197b]QFT48198.1 hypothetical protein FIU97_16565 [Roseivivax sp. THAF40]